jgi:hypothetical protein
MKQCNESYIQKYVLVENYQEYNFITYEGDLGSFKLVC